MNRNFTSKFDKLVDKILLESNFSTIKDRAIEKADDFGKNLKRDKILSPELNLSDEKSFQEFKNEIYRDIMQGQRSKTLGDVREMSYSLDIEDLKEKGLDKKKEMKAWLKENPDKTLDDYKLYKIRESESKLDTIFALYPVEFRQISNLFKRRAEIGITLDELKNKNIVDVIVSKYKDSFNFSKEFITKLFDFNEIKKNGANIGKGEFLLCLFIKGCKWPAEKCDISINDVKYEVKGSEAKVGESNGPEDILNGFMELVKVDFINNFKSLESTKNLTQRLVDAFKIFENREDTENRNFMEFQKLNNSTGFITKMKELYEPMIAKAKEHGLQSIICRRKEYKLDDPGIMNGIISDYMNHFYQVNIKGGKDSDFYISPSDLNDIDKMQTKYWKTILQIYKDGSTGSDGLGFDGIIFIGDDKILHIFEGSAENIVEAMKPFIDRNYPKFGSHSKQNYANRIVMKK